MKMRNQALKFLASFLLVLGASLDSSGASSASASASEARSKPAQGESTLGKVSSKRPSREIGKLINSSTLNIDAPTQGASQAGFCQSQTVGQRAQTPAGAEQVKKVFCFYDIQDDFRPQDLNPCLCTHVVYSYVAVRKNLSFIAGKKGESLSFLARSLSRLDELFFVECSPSEFSKIVRCSAASH